MIEPRLANVSMLYPSEDLSKTSIEMTQSVPIHCLENFVATARGEL